MSFRFGSVCVAAALVLTAVACREAPTSARGVVTLRVTPVFLSASAGIVPLAAARLTVDRLADQSRVVDTVVQIAEGDSVLDATLSVERTDSQERFLLRIALVSPQGDTVFRAGPDTVSTSDPSLAPTPLTVTLTYTGQGANAAGVSILTPQVFLLPDSSVLLEAEAYDTSGSVIVETPIAWASLDAVATVPDPAVGRVTAGSAEGTARITATLLTGQSDTATVTVQLSAYRPGNVLVLSNAEFSNAAIRDSFPLYMPGFTFDTMDVFDQTPTVAFLTQYPVVLLFEDGLFSNSTNVGDSLAAYVAAGGNLVLGTFYWQDRSDNTNYGSVGWGALENIDPFLGPDGSEYRQDSLDVSTVVAHPLTAGIDSLWVDSYHGGVVAREGTTVLARWSDSCNDLNSGCPATPNTPLIGYRIESGGQRIVGVTTYPGYMYYGGYRGDFYRLWQNALGWAAAGSQPTPPAQGVVRRSHPVVDPVQRVRTGGSN